ncbi:DUF3413 domain-containing protein [Bisgaard Taxon 10/6]|uniref:DUF3413 domain-containing protein n=1 Tax=Exercitatus varius TaxID=67857 RepID=UPI00294ADAF6|nr:DUF3413 domain-containing protein [Exercitatus varius]MDG2947503.1 DUF3413 domain-containing protein [Exercitatus varius]
MLWLKNGKIKFDRQYREQTSQKISWGHWFAFFNIIWAVLIGSRYAFIIDWPHTFFGKLYFFISLLGHFSFVTFSLYLLVIFPLSFIIKNERTFRGISVIFATLATTLLLVDTEVFARFNLHLSSVVWNLLVNPENGELSRDWQIFFTPMPFLLLVQMVFSRWAWYKLRSLERQKWIRHVGFGLTALFIFSHLIYAWADAAIYRPITMQKSNFPLSYPMTARSFLEKHGFLDKEEHQAKINQEGNADAPAIQYPKNTLAYETTAEKPNVLIITVNGLRQDALQAEKMPALYEFASRATRFNNHYTTGLTGNGAVTGLFYGLTANYTDSLLNQKLSSVLVDKLRRDQYQFGLFSATNFNDSIFRQALFSQVRMKQGKKNNESAVKNWQQWFNRRLADTPWFSYISLDLTQPMKEKNYKDLAAEQQAYEQLLKQTDQLLNLVLSQLQAQNQLENTAVIITSERGYVFRKTEKEQLEYFAPEAIKVPMIVSWKELNTGIENKLTSHIDVVPALMYNLFWVKNPNSDYTLGHNLFDHTQRPTEWVLLADSRRNVIVVPDGTQYHLDRKGNYQKFDRTYEKTSSTRPPLGLFLDVFTQSRSFIEK